MADSEGEVGRSASAVEAAEAAETAEAAATTDASGERRLDDGTAKKSKSKSERVRDTIALVLLSLTAVLTAWCGFQASKWGGEMSISFSQASAARIEAAKQQGIANQARQEDLAVYAIYAQASVNDNTKLATYVEQRFHDYFRVAFDAWNAAGQPTPSPLGMPQYVPPGSTESAAADDRADRLFAAALVDNQRGDNYTILTVLAALVLFFAALSGRVSGDTKQWVILGLAIVLFLVGASVAATFPIDL